MNDFERLTPPPFQNPLLEIGVKWQDAAGTQSEDTIFVCLFQLCTTKVYKLSPLPPFFPSSLNSTENMFVFICSWVSSWQQCAPHTHDVNHKHTRAFSVYYYYLSFAGSDSCFFEFMEIKLATHRALQCLSTVLTLVYQHFYCNPMSWKRKKKNVEGRQERLQKKKKRERSLSSPLSSSLLGLQST